VVLVVLVEFRTIERDAPLILSARRVRSLGTARHETASFAHLSFVEGKVSHDALAKIIPEDNAIQFVGSMGSRSLDAVWGARVYCEACVCVTA
jgi:hypothetical protein